jgi:hypothetical protein
MTDPKPNLSLAAIQANINYCHSQLDALDAQRDILKEQLDYWLEQKNHIE